MEESKIFFEDGTNVPLGTEFGTMAFRTLDWYQPRDSIARPDWREKWTTLRSRFERLIDECRPAECLLTQKRVPAFTNERRAIDSLLQGRELFQSTGGLGREPSVLYAVGGHALFGEFPISDAAGKPICNSTGEPFAFQYGLHRQFYISIAPTFPGETRPQCISRLMELARDANQLLFALPPDVAVTLWRHWQSGFSRSQHSDGHLWLDALFELSWQSQAGSPLHSTRHAWLKNVSVQLHGDGLFPRLIDLGRPMVSIPHENGHPIEYYARLADVARSSVAAIDEILERGRVSDKKMKHSLSVDSSVMADSSGKPANDEKLNGNEVFISYSHKDDQFLDQLLSHLRPMTRNGSVNAWSDKQIAPGSKWFEDIQRALSEARVIVFLVTKDFLASDFIIDHELAPMLKAAECGAVKIVWTLVRACSYKETALKDYQALVSPPEKPLARMKAERDDAWVRICEGIKRAALEK